MDSVTPDPLLAVERLLRNGTTTPEGNTVWMMEAEGCVHLQLTEAVEQARMMLGMDIDTERMRLLGGNALQMLTAAGFTPERAYFVIAMCEIVLAGGGDELLELGEGLQLEERS
jgi:hypothetical protein